MPSEHWCKVTLVVSLNLLLGVIYSKYYIKDQVMYAIQVGQPLNPTIYSWPPMPEYNFLDSGHELILSFPRPRPQEITAVWEATAHFAFTVVGDIIVFQYRFGGALPWSDCGYNWHRVSEDIRTLPDMPAPGERAMLRVILIDANTGIVKALRALTFSHTFIKRLHQAIREQAARPLPDDYEQQAERLFVNYSTKMLRQRAIASCTGGSQHDNPAPF